MDAFIGEIRLFTGNYAPQGWAFCHGQQVSISYNQPLYSIIGDAFGTDYLTYFTLPDLRGLVPIHQGSGVGLTPWQCYEKGGSITETINTFEMPNHTHQLNAQTGGNATDASDNIWATTPRGTTVNVYNEEQPNSSMNVNAVTASGGSQAHNNMQPYLAINYIICLEDGMYPVKAQ
ncbi:hypothetical protein BBD42_10315 [Paenibacillus sp. BIHB 4019]|uniref:Phage tail collar domain-containing protein n=1 Tax=Paenibacillus sp. BIHB 4019 TaxID=1870819 RepID=A0A1B2DGH3_9BACL|nr:tail fiber protein [Paenibacillus sp. BIHB 4019]ANY66812.1 hypothetical protein BBD42_10315 [Paenibacillus sp. BIHB 4019]